MSKIDKLIQRLLNNPKDFTWDEVVQILKHFGFFELKTGKTTGSGRKFVNEKKKIIILHKPHPVNVVKPYAVKIVIDILKGENLI